jgi:hypothetical protein
MDKHEGSFFWGVLLGAVTMAIAGGLMLARSCRSYSVGIDSWEDLPKKKTRPAAKPGKAGKKRRVVAKK